MSAEGSILANLGINWFSFLTQFINLAIVFFILKKYVYRPVMQKLDERASLIRKGNKAAEKNIKIQENTKKEIEEMMQKARIEASKVIQNAKEIGIESQKKIIKKAKEDAKILIEKERAKAEEAMKNQRKELENKVIDIAVSVARKALSDSLDKKTQEKIINQQMKQLSSFSLN